MRCSVQSCLNRGTKKKNTGGHKITFHLFPKDPKHRAAWVEALHIKDWQPSDTSVVCSEHFKKEDFYDTKTGARRIINGVVPQISIDLDDPAVLRVCRICLGLDCKMYDMKEFHLDVMYENITGRRVCDEECMLGKLPPRLCWECAARLRAADAFRAKALLSDGLLYDLLKTEPIIIVGDIISINRKHTNLKSSLAVQKLFDTEEPNESHKDHVKTEEIDVTHNDAIETGDFETVETETDVKNLVTEMRIKDEDNEVFIEEYENFNNDEVKTEVDLVPTGVEITVRDRKKYSEPIYCVHDDSDLIDVGLFEYEDKKTNTEAMDVDGDSETESFEDTNSQIINNYDVATTENENTKVIKILDLDDVANDLQEKDEKTDVTSVVNKSPKILLSMLAKKQTVRTDSEMVRKREAKRVADKPGPAKRSNRSYVKPRQPIDEELFSITKLTLEQQIQEVQKRKNSNRYKIAPFQCTVCYRGFPTKDKYTRHALKHSEKSGSYQCDICKIRCKANWALRGHMSRQHNEEYSCKQCPFLTKSRGVALEHIKFHAGRTFTCPQCPTEFEKKTTLLNHLRLKHMSDAVCELCGYTFVSKIGVHAHKRLKHPLVDKDIKLEGPHCSVCDVIFLSRKAYDKHLRLSSKHIENEDDPNRLSNDPAIKCRRIGAPFKSHRERRPRIHVRDDVIITKPNEPVDCEQCGMVLQNLHAYTCHFKTVHPGFNRTKFPYMSTPYMCEQCGKMFLNKTLLKSHMWVHTGEKGFQCDHCKKWFSQKSNLAGHMRLHYGSPRPYECRVCGKLFTSPSNRSRHMFLHTGLKPFKCEACEKCFPTTGELRAHVDYVHLKKPRPKRERRRAKKADMSGVEY